MAVTGTNYTVTGSTEAADTSSLTIWVINAFLYAFGGQMPTMAQLIVLYVILSLLAGVFAMLGTVFALGWIKKIAGMN